MPRLDDDGQTVTLDLHGARVDEAAALARAAVIEAARRGRRTVRLVHGHSTTDPLGGTRTIKTVLLDLVDESGFRPHVTTSLRMEGELVLGIAPAPAPVAGRIRLSDLR